jgi:hypothetical protein
MPKSLVICPVGMPMPFDARYDSDNHWRYTNKLDREYDTLVVVYNDFEPEPNSYDFILRMKGHKWQIIQKVFETFDYSSYDYIGCVDDDLITDIQSFNKGIKLARMFNSSHWQLSMPHDSSLIYQPLFQDPSCDVSETNFIEMGSCFFRNDQFTKLLKFMKYADFKIGWGIDKVFCDVLESNANVIHVASIHQPFRDSYYDKTDAMNEMNEFLFTKYPKIMQEHYGRNPNWVDMQVTLKKYKVTGVENV